MLLKSSFFTIFIALMKALKIILCILIVTCVSTFHAQTFNESGIASGINFSPHPTGYMGGGVAVFDYDSDGYEDLYVNGCLEHDRLYHNNGDGTFEDVTGSAGLDSSGLRNTIGVATGDFDNDGHPDVFVSTWRNLNDAELARNILFHNNGDGSFTDISEDAGIIEQAFSTGATFIDINLDGYLDIYVGNYVEATGFIYEDNVIVGFDHTCFENFFYLNNGNGTFTEMAEEYGINDNGCSLATIASDFDLDADSDIMIANDFGEFVVPNGLYENDFPNESCIDVGELSGADIGLYGMGVASGDYDEDQDMDYYISNLGSNALLQNNGSGIFQDVAFTAQVDNTGADSLFYTSWGTFFFDYNNDSWLDLFVCNGHMPSVSMVANHVLDPNKLYSNNQDGTFTDVSIQEGIADENIGRGCAWGDFNNDGFADIVSVNIFNELVAGPDNVLYYQNTPNDNHWLGLTLEGVNSNMDAYGSVIHIYLDDRVLVREVIGGGTHASQSSNRVLIGLGDSEQVDSLAIDWPGGFHESFVPEIDQYHHLIEGQVTSMKDFKHESRGLKVFPNPASDKLFVDLQPFLGKDIEIAIYTIQGREISKLFKGSIVENGPMEFDIPNIGNGYYVIGVYSQNGIQSIPFSVVKE